MKKIAFVAAGLAAGSVALAVPAQAAPTCTKTSNSISCTSTNGSVSFVATPGGGVSISGTAGNRAFSYQHTATGASINSTGGLADVHYVRSGSQVDATVTVAGKKYSYSDKLGDGKLPKVTVTDVP